MVDSSTTSPTTEESMEVNPEDVVDGTPPQPPTIGGVQKVVGDGGEGGGKVGSGGGGVGSSGVNSGGVTGGEKVVGEAQRSSPPKKEKIPPTFVSNSPPPPAHIRET